MEVDYWRANRAQSHLFEGGESPLLDVLGCSRSTLALGLLHEHAQEHGQEQAEGCQNHHCGQPADELGQRGYRHCGGQRGYLERAHIVRELPLNYSTALLHRAHIVTELPLNYSSALLHRAHIVPELPLNYRTALLHRADIVRELPLNYSTALLHRAHIAERSCN